MRAVFRDDLSIEFKEIARSNTDMHEKLCRYLDEQVSKAILANTLSTDAGASGSYSLGKVQAESKYDTVRAYGHQWAACLQGQLVAVYVAWKYGPDAPVPRVVIEVEEAEDLLPASEIVKNLVEAGVLLDAAEIREKFGYRNPEEGAETVGGAVGVVPGITAPQSRQAASGCPVHSVAPQGAGTVPRDALDDLADQMLQEYEPLSAEIDRRLAVAAQSAGSLEDLRAAVQAVIKDFDISALQEMLASARLKARLTGDLGGEV
jgi:phage gp29-like protein